MSGQPDAETLAALKAMLGPRGYIDEEAQREPFETDFRGTFQGRTPLVALPDSTALVADFVRFCAERRLPLVPHGGNTGYGGGATPRAAGGDIVVSLRRLNRVRSIADGGSALTAEAGCVLSGLQAAAAERDRLLPMSLGSEGSCTLGGLVSTNAGGTAVLRYGMMRDLVLGIEAVLPDGRVLDQLGCLRKDNTGYDVKQLFIGAEGTLGIVTAACLKLFPRPSDVVTVLVAVGSPSSALALLRRLEADLGPLLSAFELMPAIALELVCRHVPECAHPIEGEHPWYVLVEADVPGSGNRDGMASAVQASLADAVREGEARDAVVATSGRQRSALWRLREEIPAAEAREAAELDLAWPAGEAFEVAGRAVRGLSHDVSVPPGRMPEFLVDGDALMQRLAPGARLVAYGHLADGNLHFNVLPPPRRDGASSAASIRTGSSAAAGPGKVTEAVYELVARHGGSFSAEHGIGQLKREPLERYEDPVALSLMRDIKRLLDPHGIMNPGKVLPEG